jgi:hypothetical protein
LNPAGDGSYHGKLWVSAVDGRPGGEVFARWLLRCCRFD